MSLYHFDGIFVAEEEKEDRMEGEGEIGLQGDHLDPGLQTQNREDVYESRSSSNNNNNNNNNNNVEAVGSGDDQDANDVQDAHNDDQEPPRKKSHRHTSRQIQVLESFFKEFPHPDENQRTELSEKIGLECRQIKFWFQNRRTQMKTQKERQENMRLRQEHSMSQVVNETLKEAMRNPLCTRCGSLVAATGGCGVESNFELHQLRMENARLKEELDKIGILANKFLGKPLTSSVSPLFQSMNPSSGEGSSSAPPPPPPMAAGGLTKGNNGGGIPFDRNVFVELAVAAMDQLMKLAQQDTPLWLRTSDGRKEVLNQEEYARVFQPCIGLKPNGFVSEASRESDVVLINSLALVETLMNPKRWAAMFSSIVAGAGIIDVVASSDDGTRNGTLQLMYAEFQVPTPFIPVRQVRFLRFCKQHMEGLWSVVDVSIDINRDGINADEFRTCRRLPSGCVVQDLQNNCSQVTWIEHSEYDERVIHNICRRLVRSGWGFGAQRWVANLQRHCECLEILMSTAEIAEHPLGIGPEGRKSVLALAQRMMYKFFSAVCVSSLCKWDKLHVEGVPEDVRVLTRRSRNDPGEPTGIVLSASTSIWLPTTKQSLFDFISDERMRTHWDVLTTDGQWEEVGHIFKGQYAGNCVSILRDKVSTLMILQETWNYACGSLVVYTPLDLHSVNMLMAGADSSTVTVLPSGFAIHPDGRNGHGTTSNDNEGSNFNETSGGCILTVIFQILLNSLHNHTISVESVETISKLVTCTIRKINEFIQET
ncbi:hypothetical protein Ddye_011363 [Dipteronia dyeriana]|uniref:Uncharacterized protein n=1 Tax=Dipteronia dyeriana TaxID=168575 RepID=A0AAE0CGV6_9ROSI|nr:hypothetical protein Ddye_011363 [Dipteronia dyeriana]